MDAAKSGYLANLLRNHHSLSPEDIERRYILNALLSTGEPKPGMFYREVSPELQLIPYKPDENFYIKRVLSNKKAADYLRRSFNPFGLKEVLKELAYHWRRIDKDQVTQRLLQDGDILRMMAQAYEMESPLSVLGMLELK